MSIRKHLRNKVDIVHIQMESKTGRTETGTDLDVSAFISHKRRFIMDTQGNSILCNMMVVLAPNTNISDTDEIIADGHQRPIVGILKPRNPRSGKIDHLEALLQ